jgi:hypothetical protein
MFPAREKELVGVLDITCSLSVVLYKKEGPEGLGK